MNWTNNKSKIARPLTLVLGLAMLVTPSLSQSFTPASANTATISDSNNICPISISSGSTTIDTNSVSVSVVGSNCVIQFLTTASYSVTIPTGITQVSYLVVGGGGGGGSGGGGAGGVLQGSNYSVTSGSSYTVTVGAGGVGGCGGVNNCPSSVNAANGSSSTFATVTALGGGSGGQGNHAPGNGASGGGARYDCTSACFGTGTPGQGTNGANSTHGGYGGGAGGGGAGSAGGNTTLYHIGGAGGNGVTSSITGATVYYGGGGGGGINENSNTYCGVQAPGTSDSNYYCNGGTPTLTGGGAGGLGGGGRGSDYGYSSAGQGTYANATAGQSNTGGGGGGVDPEDFGGKAGGSGVVVLSYVATVNLRTITFNSNINSNQTTSQTVLSGASTQLQANTFSATGYIFRGWNTQADGSGTSYPNLGYITTTTNLALYAQWVPGVNHTVTFYSNTGVGGPTTQVAGQSTNLNANTFTKSGYTFTGWNTVAGGTGYGYLDQSVYSFAADTNLYAQWAQVVTPHTVSFYGNGATGGGTNSQTASTNQPLNLNGFTRTGYSFLGWDTNNSASTATYQDGQNYSFSADIALYAIWVAQASHTITFNGNGSNGSNGGSTNPQTATLSTTLNANGFTKTGYTFISWNTLANGQGVSYSSSYTYSFAASITLYATWSQNFTITYDGNTSDSGTVPGAQGYYANGPLVTVQTNTGGLTKAGYILTGWNTQAGGGGTAYALGQANSTFASNTVLYAQWTGASYTILYTGNSNTGGVVPSSQSYTYGNPGITLNTNTGSLVRSGYTFNGWNTRPDGSGTAFASGATGATFTQDTVLFAAWTPLQYTITYNPETGTVGTPTVTYTSGTPALVLPTPSLTGNNFSGWYDTATAGTLVGAAGANYTPVASLTLYAYWTPATYAISYDGNNSTVDTSTVSYVYGNSPLVLRTPTRNSFAFLGWYTATTGGTRLGGAGDSFTPAATQTVHAQWVQNSLANLVSPTPIGTITTTNGVGNSFTATSGSTTVTVTYTSNALPAGTVITDYLQGDLTHERSLITGSTNILLSTVVSWLAPDLTVPATAGGSPITITITDPNIQVGAQIYILIGSSLTLAGTATSAGTATASVTTDPEIIINNPPAVTPPSQNTPPIQNSYVNGLTPSRSVVGAAIPVVAQGNFVERITNIQVNGVSLPANSWTQTSSTVSFTMPQEPIGTYSVQLFNGSSPSLAPQSFQYYAAIKPSLSWTVQTSAADNSWTSVTFGNGAFVAVASTGSGNRVMRSTDGVHWVTEASAADSTWSSVTYGNGLFVAVANSGTTRIMTSPDGITWTGRSYPLLSTDARPSHNYSTVKYGDGVFVAIASSYVASPIVPEIIYSADGITWKRVTSFAVDSSQVLVGQGNISLGFGNGKFVITTVSGRSALGQVPELLTSSNGVDWFRYIFPLKPIPVQVNAHAFGCSVFVASVRQGGDYTATDPTNWVGNGIIDQIGAGLTYSNGLFVGVSTTTVTSSSDGITWNSSAPPVANAWDSAAYGNGIFVAVASSGTGNRVMTTPYSALLALSSSTETVATGTPIVGYQPSYNGCKSPTYSISPTPSNGTLSFNPTTGLLSGTPSVADPGTTYTITVHDGENGDISSSYTLVVTASTSSGSTSSTGSASQPISQGSGQSSTSSAGKSSGSVGNPSTPNSGNSSTGTKPTSGSTSTSAGPLASPISLETHFDMGSDVVKGADLAQLQKLARKIAGLGKAITIQVIGYAQPTPGTEATDGPLSARRAANVAKILKQDGVTTKVVYLGAGRATVNDPSSRYVKIVAANS